MVCAKTAVTVALLVIMMQLEPSRADPDHAVNCQPSDAAAARHTREPLTYGPLGGVAVTTPPPEGEAFTVSENSCAKVAVIAAFAVMVRHPEPSSGAPVHPVNCQPEVGVAVRQTFVPLAYDPPGGFAMIVPPPDGDTAKASVYSWAKVAVTVVFAVIVRQFAESSAGPDHEANCHPDEAIAVRQTFVPLIYDPPPGFPVSVPAAAGDTLRASVYTGLNIAVTVAFPVMVRQL